MSLLLCLATAGLWAWSYRGMRQVEFRYRGQPRRVWIEGGKVGVDNEPQVLAAEAKEEHARQMVNAIPGSGFLMLIPRAGVLVDPPSQVPPRWSRSSDIPLPAATALLLLAPALSVVHWRRRRRRLAAGRCVACGYDLTANTSGVCPECGMAVKGKAGAQP